MKTIISLSATSMKAYKEAEKKIKDKYNPKIELLEKQLKDAQRAAKKDRAAIEKELTAAQSQVAAVEKKLTAYDRKSGVAKLQGQIETLSKSRLKSIIALRNKHRMR